MSIILPASVDRVLLTGASGAIGQRFLSELLMQGAKVTCLTRTEATARLLQERYGGWAGNSMQVLRADLRCDKSIAELTKRLEHVGCWMVVHCAADVSWTKPRRLLEEINVGGTRRITDAAITCSVCPPLFVYLSTAFIGPEGETRNAYEATKLEAEELLQTRFADKIRLAIVRCSLVIGRSSDGKIDRFNGIYPLIRVIATGALPCLIAQSAYRIDAVPIESVVKEAIACACAAENASGTISAVVAAGNQAIEVGDFVRIVVEEANRFRTSIGLERLPEVSVISSRQFRFLMQASEAWGMRERFKKVEQLSSVLSGYIVHGESFCTIQPAMVTSLPPDLKTFLSAIVRFWLEKHTDLVRSTLAPTWLTGVEA